MLHLRTLDDYQHSEVDENIYKLLFSSNHQYFKELYGDCNNNYL